MKNNIILSLGLSLLLLFGCNKKNGAGFYGNFEADEFVIPSLANGRLISLLVKEGDTCSKDQLLAIADTTILSLERTKVKSSIRALQEMGMFSQMEPLMYELRIIEERIKLCYVKSPQRGKILKINLREGEYMLEGTPLIVLTDFNRIFFTAWVPGESLYSISSGDTVEILSDLEGGKLASNKGVVINISERPQFIPSMVQTRSGRTRQHYRVRAELKNDGSLKGGMPGELVILK